MGDDGRWGHDWREFLEWTRMETRQRGTALTTAQLERLKERYNDGRYPEHFRIGDSVDLFNIHLCLITGAVSESMYDNVDLEDSKTAAVVLAMATACRRDQESEKIITMIGDTRPQSAAQFKCLHNAFVSAGRGVEPRDEDEIDQCSRDVARWMAESSVRVAKPAPIQSLSFGDKNAGLLVGSTPGVNEDSDGEELEDSDGEELELGAGTDRVPATPLPARSHPDAYKALEHAKLAHQHMVDAKESWKSCKEMRNQEYAEKLVQRTFELAGAIEAIKLRLPQLGEEDKPQTGVDPPHIADPPLVENGNHRSTNPEIELSGSCSRVLPGKRRKSESSVMSLHDDSEDDDGELDGDNRGAGLSFKDRTSHVVTREFYDCLAKCFKDVENVRSSKFSDADSVLAFDDEISLPPSFNSQLIDLQASALGLSSKEYSGLVSTGMKQVSARGAARKEMDGRIDHVIITMKECARVMVAAQSDMDEKTLQARAARDIREKDLDRSTASIKALKKKCQYQTWGIFILLAFVVLQAAVIIQQIRQ